MIDMNIPWEQLGDLAGTLILGKGGNAKPGDGSVAGDMLGAILKRQGLGNYQPAGGNDQQAAAQHQAAVNGMGQQGNLPGGNGTIPVTPAPTGGMWNGNVMDKAQTFFPADGGGQAAPRSASPVLNELMQNPAPDFKKEDYQFLFQKQPRYYSHTPTGLLYQ